jgi:peptide-methionine (R)-S-oxide reductase
MNYKRDEPRSSRRQLLGWLGAGVSFAGLAALGSRSAQAKAHLVSLTDAEWRRRLNNEEYRILRQGGTEPAFSSPLNHEKRAGTFVCAGCGNGLYSSQTKFDSGTGWPSFWQPLPGAVVLGTDRKLGYARVEVRCADCNGHLGHVFNDGLEPSGKRYCMDGGAMDFRPA